ncbi:TPA: hypothetical protein NG675_003485 [Vibrio parahaemolyticus]|uniref:hypothetical protein n=2 Tax=Vibrio parahaemolyticus TaxID=670 RepID=UPI000416E63F|nr:hypothetical protein [Vibrio parahaemolyticus]KIT48947.1 hypothetical protein H334_08700 [Vibrio parahaemolyticus 901128]EGR3179491.1 hypothetical protein [Vibrio parahaemolyticus]EHR0918833.1 hypothetical protein [Vibrio parahaemolyticus]EHR6436395.1 hypothetical protein [Vibrio parahaemolyticus]EHR6584448.1 hypothetical protein [Vibrio parahaemolyticus]
MLCPSLLSSQNINPEEILSSLQIDRKFMTKRIIQKMNEVNKKRKKGLTDADKKYFHRLLTAIEQWDDQELADLASEPSEFRKLMQGW